MVNGKHVAYYRVSTAKQGRSGLGLEGQKAAVLAHLNGGASELVGEVVEVESGKRDDNRPKLQEALRLCRTTGAALIVAKLDRLSRDAEFLMRLQKASVPFVCADMPGANNFTVGVMALVAQQERDAISTRTKAALAAARARGVKLGGNRGHILPSQRAAAESAKVRQAFSLGHARDVLVSIEQAKAKGAVSLRDIAAALNKLGINTPRGGPWRATQVARIIDRTTA